MKKPRDKGMALLNLAKVHLWYCGLGEGREKLFLHKQLTYGKVNRHFDKAKGSMLDARDFQNFYASPLGSLTSLYLSRQIRDFWPSVTGMVVLGIGYPFPYLEAYANQNTPVFMPAEMGALSWQEANKKRSKKRKKGSVSLVHPASLPLLDHSIDRLLLIHTLEYAPESGPLLREAARILKPQGRLLVIVPNRLGLWSRTKETPFGYGHSYSKSQLSFLLNSHGLTPTQSKTCLHFFPRESSVLLAWASFCERLGQRMARSLGGVICMEAIKEVYGQPSLKYGLAPASFVRLLQFKGPL